MNYQHVYYISPRFQPWVREDQISTTVLTVYQILYPYESVGSPLKPWVAVNDEPTNFYNGLNNVNSPMEMVKTIEYS